jgi:hypothetical protein
MLQASLRLADVTRDLTGARGNRLDDTGGRTDMTALGTGIAQRYDVYDIAYLAGGPARVADTAVVALVRSDRIRAHASGRLSARTGSSPHPVEAAVLDLVGPRERRSIGTVRWRLAADDRLAAVARRLAGDGLIHASAPWWAAGRAVSRTRAGRRLLRDLTGHLPPDRIAAETGALLTGTLTTGTLTTGTMAVALGGAARLGEDELYRRIFAPPRPSRASRNADRLAGRERIFGSPHAYAPIGIWGGGDGWGGGFGDGGGGCGGFGDGGGGCGGGDGGGGGC